MGEAHRHYRGSDGELRVLESCCAHRQLPLTLGDVDGCHLACAYHGWTHDGQGRLVGIPHDLFGRPMPSLAIASYPVKVRYGLIWVLPGDPARARERSIPDIPELEGGKRWACAPVDFTWRAHDSPAHRPEVGRASQNHLRPNAVDIR